MRAGLKRWLADVIAIGELDSSVPLVIQLTSGILSPISGLVAVKDFQIFSMVLSSTVSCSCTIKVREAFYLPPNEVICLMLIILIPLLTMHQYLLIYERINVIIYVICWLILLTDLLFFWLSCFFLWTIFINKHLYERQKLILNNYVYLRWIRKIPRDIVASK